MIDVIYVDFDDFKIEKEDGECKLGVMIALK
jgi:hypothetical protein